MRTKRLRKRKRNTLTKLSILSVSILFLGLFFFQDVYSKEKTPSGSQQTLTELPQSNNTNHSFTHSGRNTSQITKTTNFSTTANDEIIEDKDDERKTEQDEEPAETDSNESGAKHQENQPVEESKKDNSSHKQNEKKKNNQDKVIYLTFDDGPQNFTVEILDMLEKYDAKATFFMLEPQMRQYPEIVKDIVKRGHQVGLHSVTHDKNKFYQSKTTVVSEMQTSQATLESITGVKTHLIRTPYGSNPHMKPEYREGVKNAGFYMWDWNIDSRDWSLTDGSFIDYTIDQIVGFDRNEPKIVLLHDRTTTLEHLESLLIYLSSEGYSMPVLTTEIEPVQFKM